MKRLLILFSLVGVVCSTVSAKTTTVQLEKNRCGLVANVSTPAGTFRFLVDTGAGLCVVSQHFVETNSLTKQKTASTSDSSGYTTELQLTSIPTFQIGDRMLKDVLALVFEDDSFVFKCFGLDGILGGNVLQNFVARFSDRELTLTLGDKLKDLGEPKHSKCVKLSGIDPKRIGQTRPIMMLAFAGAKNRPVKLPFVIDTGATGLCTESFKLLEDAGVLDNIRHASGYSSSIGLTARNGIKETATAIAPTVSLGEVSVHDVRIYSEKQNLIGTFILKYCDLIIDYPHSRAFFVADKKDHCCSDGENSIKSVSTVFTAEQGMLIGCVWDPSLTSVSPGDKIVDIDGASTAEWTICTALNNTGANKSITVRTKEGLKSVGIESFK